MRVNKSDLSFLLIMNKIAEKSTAVQLSVKEGKAFAYLIHPVNGTIISEFPYEGEEDDFEIVTNFSSLFSLLNTVKDDSFEIIHDTGLTVRFNKGNSEHTLEIDEYAKFPDMSEFLDQVEGEAKETVTVTDFLSYGVIQPFIAIGDLNKSASCLFMQRDHYVAVDDPMNRSLVTMVKTESEVKQITSVNRIFTDIASGIKADSLTVRKFDGIDYAKIGNTHILIGSVSFLAMPDWFDEGMKSRYDHKDYFTFDTEIILASLTRFQLMAKDKEQQKIVISLTDKVLTIKDQIGKSKEEIPCVLSNEDMSGWEFAISASRLKDVCSTIRKGKLKIHVKENHTNEVVKIQTEDGAITFVLATSEMDVN